jgi:hypothetical protein
MNPKPKPTEAQIQAWKGTGHPQARQTPSPQNGEPPMHDTLPAMERTHLERLKLAADILLAEHDAITDPLEVELTLFRERVELALLAGHAS